MKTSIISAVAENGVIGVDGTLAWHYPEDLRHFKETTMGHPVIMGRHTYDDISESIGGSLPGRTNIVLSQSVENLHDNPQIARTLDESLSIAEDSGADAAYIIGGESIYTQFLDAGLVDELVLTEIPEQYDGDAYFPRWETRPWRELNRETLGDDGLAVVTYEV